MFSLGFNAFMNLNSQGSAIIQEILSREDLKLEDLLDEEAISYEIKTQNQSLTNFLLKKENFDRLITYIITEPEIDDFEFDQKKFYKYPFVSAELLSSESQIVADEFFKSKATLEAAQTKPAQTESVNGNTTATTADDSGKIVTEESQVEAKESTAVLGETVHPVYLERLVEILNTKVTNLTCAGYFVKVVNNLVTKKPLETMAYIYKGNGKILDKLVENIHSKSIADLLGRLLTFEGSLLNDNVEEVYNDERVRVLKALISKLDASSDLEESNNAAYLICEVFGKYNSMHASQVVLGKILERQTIDVLFGYLKSKNPHSACATALVLGNIFAYYILINTKAPAEQQSVEDVTVRVEEFSPMHLPQQHAELGSDIPLIAAFLDNLKSIIEYVVNSNSSSTEQVKTQFGTTIVPFGSDRLKFLELLIISIKAHNKDIYAKLVENNLFKGLLELITKYEWNNMLHNQIEKLLSIVLENSQDDLKASLFESAGLLEFIIKASNEEDYVIKGKKDIKLRRGYLGHLYKIANRIVESKDAVVEKFTKENTAWTDFVQNKLAEANNKDKTILGGKDPRAMSEGLGNPNVQLELPSIMEKFSKFFNMQSKPEQKNLEEEVIDEDEGSPGKPAHPQKAGQGVPRDEIEMIVEDKTHTVSEGAKSALENAYPTDSVPTEVRKTFGAKGKNRLGHEEGDEEKEDTLWFSEPTAKKGGEGEKMQEEHADKTTGVTSVQAGDVQSSKVEGGVKMEES